MRREARELLIKTRVYRFFAISFAAIGMIIFLFLYFKHIDGRLMDALTDLKTVFIVLVPFLPAAVLAALAAKTESKFYKLLHSPGPSDDNADKQKKDG